MIPASIAILYTRECNYVCDHCSVCSAPSTKEHMESSLVEKITNEAYKIPSIRTIVFTGGEPMLNLDKLKNDLALVRYKGFTTRIVTNAWWANDYEECENTMYELSKSGLHEINVSYDDFHLPYLNKFGGEKNIFNIALAAKKIGITLLYGMVLHPKSTIRSSDLEKKLEQLGVTGTLFLEGYVAPLGRARQTLDDSFFIPQDSSGHCGELVKTINIQPNGDVAFCCGHAIFTGAKDFFIVGNINDDSLKSIIKKMQKNMLLWFLWTKGPEEVMKYLDIQENIHNMCEICYLLGTKYKNRLPELIRACSH